MPEVTRRELFKGSLALCASTAISAPDLVQGAQLKASSGSSQAANESPAASPRERILLDPGWRFRLGHANDPEKDLGFGAMKITGTFAKTGELVPAAMANYDDKDWRAVDLPHDWAVELPFEQEPFLTYHGAKPLGRDYPAASIGWYRRVFTLDKNDAGKRISILFDGVFRHAMVALNGIYVGSTHSGYPPFSFDITDFVTVDGPNVLLVRVDAALSEGWFYEGAGIYRHVWLLKKDPVYLEEWSPVVRTSAVTPTSAKLAMECEAKNASDVEAACGFSVEILAPDGSVAARAETAKQTLPPGESCVLHAATVLKSPRLWSVEEPNLYRAVFSLDSNGKIVDGESVTFGVRTVHFDADQGFFLNGKNVKIKGTCNHQDHAGVGSALPDRLQSYRLEILKEMGSNACRTSHNSPTPEFLDACDRLGMMAMVETRMWSSSPQGLDDLGKMIRRFRNHPSIILWSLGNEEPLQGTQYGERIARTMKKLAHKLDPTRLCTQAMNNEWGSGVSKVLDVQGFNYNLSLIDDFHRKFPKQPTIGTETGSTVSTRGIYENDPVRGYVSAYDVNRPKWAELAEEWWSFYDSRPFLSGGFTWTGFDYRGEPTPYNWPCISSHFGLIDTCGFPKDIYFYYQAWWSAKPTLHLFPHWSWPGREGQQIEVWCYSNLDSVDLFLNGKSLGSKPVRKNSHVAWKVSYAPGVLEARGSKNGKVVMTEKHETVGMAAGIALRPDRMRIAANGTDVSVVRVEIVDAEGRMAPTAGNLVEFALDGPGRIIGVGNGDPSCHEPDKAARRSAFNGLCMAIIQSRSQGGSITVHAASAGLTPASAVIATA